MRDGRKLLYLAGPEVFWRDAVDVGEHKKRICAEYGFEGLFPLDNAVPLWAPNPAMAIYRANMALMRRADGGIFNLTPFRGPSADVGTGFELGFMTGLGKPVFGYSIDRRELRHRVCGVRRHTGKWLDEHGMEVEDFGLADNLMLDCTLLERGQPMVRGPSSWVEAFTECLELADREFSAGRSRPIEA